MWPTKKTNKFRVVGSRFPSMLEFMLGRAPIDRALLEWPPQTTPTLGPMLTMASAKPCFALGRVLGTKDPGLPCPDGGLPGLGFRKRQMLRRGWSSVLGEREWSDIAIAPKVWACEECHPHRENPIVLVLWCDADRGRRRGSPN